MNNLNNRRLHYLAGEIVGQAMAHQELKDRAKDKFGVESTRHLTDAQAMELLLDLEKAVGKMHHAIHAPLAREDGEAQLISKAQIDWARDMKRELEWSDEYFAALLRDRFETTELETMPAWKGVRLIQLLRERRDSKRAKMERRVA